MVRNKDTVFTRCIADIKLFENNGMIEADKVQKNVEQYIDKLGYDGNRLAAQVITAICLSQLQFRAIGGRSRIYLNPNLIKDFNQLGQIINNAKISNDSKGQIVENLKAIGDKNFPGQMFFDSKGFVDTEKSIEEIVEELRAVI